MRDAADVAIIASGQISDTMENLSHDNQEHVPLMNSISEEMAG